MRRITPLVLWLALFALIAAALAHLASGSPPHDSVAGAPGVPAEPAAISGAATRTGDVAALARKRSQTQDPPQGPDLSPPGVVEEPAGESREPTRADCVVAVDRARALAQELPRDHMSRRFAERHLLQAMTEAGNGEYDDCLYWAEFATQEAQGRLHELKPGETIKVMGADELPPPQPQAAAPRKSRQTK